jgi:hypothetical protein
MTRPAGNSTFCHGVLLVAAIVVLLLAFALDVHDEDAVVLPLLGIPLPHTCSFERLTGFGCPGCGLTRCFISIAHGDLLRAWHFNPAGVAIFLLVVIQIPYRAAQLWRIQSGRCEWRPVTLSTAITTAILFALLGQWVWRLILGSNP